MRYRGSQPVREHGHLPAPNRNQPGSDCRRCGIQRRGLLGSQGGEYPGRVRPPFGELNPRQPSGTNPPASGGPSPGKATGTARHQAPSTFNRQPPTGRPTGHHLPTGQQPATTDGGSPNPSPVLAGTYAGQNPWRRRNRPTAEPEPPACLPPNPLLQSRRTPADTRLRLPPASPASPVRRRRT